MTTLRDLQISIQDYLHQKSLAAEDLIEGENKSDRKRRLQIYQDAYLTRLRDNLAKQFPLTCIYVGGTEFESLSNGYIETFPPDHFAIRIFGQSFAKFLSDRAQTEKQKITAELAEFEWCFNEMLDNSAESELLTQQDLTGISPEKLTQVIFKLQPALYIKKFHYDVPVLWQALQKNANNRQASVEAGEFHYVLWRNKMQPYFKKISIKELTILNALQHRASFAELVEKMLEFCSEDTAANEVAQVLLACLQEAWLMKDYDFKN